MKKSKGFTLIELLAVIVILAVIALIVTPMIMSTINSAREGAAKSSAYEYIHAVETRLAVLAMSDKTYAADGTLNVAAGAITVPITDTDHTSANGYSWESLVNHATSVSGSIIVNGLTVKSASLDVTNGSTYSFTYDGTTLTKK